MTSFSRAIARPPATSFAQGLTSANLGAPDLERALAQHAEYCRALEHCGVRVTMLEPDSDFPDSTFVEDAAVLVGDLAVLTRPAAMSRRGEVDGIAALLSTFRRAIERIEAPGTLDGGDVCEADGVVFIGLSRRTNEEGAEQLIRLLARRGLQCCTVDVRALTQLLHLKSGVSWLGGDRIVVAPALAGHPAFAPFQCIELDPADAYAANCIAVNGRVLLPLGHPLAERELAKTGLEPVALDMSEFRKMDGGVSCLSLRFGNN